MRRHRRLRRPKRQPVALALTAEGYRALSHHHSAIVRDCNARRLMPEEPTAQEMIANLDKLIGPPAPQKRRRIDPKYVADILSEE